jgi:chromate transporter
VSVLDWWHYGLFHLSVSLLAVGGAVTLVPDLYRYAVTEHSLLSAAQFKHALVLAQAAPGPNVLYVALVGWQVGVNAAGPGASGWAIAWLGGLGMLIGLLAVLLPSSFLTLSIARWCNRHQGWLGVQAFRQGMAPIVVGVLLSGAWLLARADGHWAASGGLWIVSGVCTLLVWRTRLHLLWMLSAGALVGAAGLI